MATAIRVVTTGSAEIDKKLGRGIAHGSLRAGNLPTTQVRGAHMGDGNVMSFDIDPGIGIRIIPVTKARA